MEAFKHGRGTDEEYIEKCKKNFEKHVITIEHECSKVKRYRFSEDGTWCFGMNITCANNMISVNGDCGTLMIEPGYGRCGLAFMLDCCTNTGYFLGKQPYGMGWGDIYMEYDADYAKHLILEHLIDYLELEQEEIDEKMEDVYGLDDGSLLGMSKYYEWCYENDVEEPCSPTIIESSVLNMLAGLHCFIEQYNKMTSREV